MKYIVCVPQGGLNDMLCQCLCSINYAIKTNRICFIATSHTAYRQNLSDYFDCILPNVYFIDLSQLEFLNNFSCYPECLQGKITTYKTINKNYDWFELETNTPLKLDFDTEYTEDIVVHESAGGGNSIEIFKYFHLKNHVREKFQQRLAKLPENFVGIHIRHTDYKNHDLEWFYSIIKTDIENTPYFLASDNHTCIEDCLRRFPSGICLSTPLKLKDTDVNLHYSTSKWATQEQIQKRNLDAILDVLILGYSTILYASFPHSGYAKLGIFFRQNKSLLDILVKTDKQNEDYKSSISFDTIQPFKFRENRYLFFDIFRTNDNKIICICPQYVLDASYFENIKLFYNGIELNKIPTKVQKLHWHIQDSSIRLEYDFPSTINCAEILVGYETEFRLYYLYSPPIQDKKYTLIQSTLFKHDKHLFPIFFNYYSQFQIGKYYLYYNGKVSEKILNFFKEYPNVQIIEWDYLYTHKKYDADVWHHAQPCQVTHVLYKYGKQYADYILLNDFDEYIDMQGNSLQMILQRNMYDMLIFENYWADLPEDNTYFPKKIPNTFYCSEKRELFPHQSKCIFKTSSIDTLSMHQAFSFTKQNPYICPIYFKLYHFWKWSGKNRTLETQTLHTLSEYNEIDIVAFLEKFGAQQFVYVPNPGNNGDSLIAKGALEVLKKAKLSYEIGHHTNKYSGRFILYAGGGNLVGIYKECERFLENNLNSHNVIIILPHTIRNIDKLFDKFNQNVFLICRERGSYNYCKERAFFKENILLSHDLAFQITNLDIYIRKPHYGSLNAFRLDCEKTNIQIPEENVDLSNMNKKFNNTRDPQVINEVCNFMFSIISDYEEINTNRLHVAIAGALLGRRVNLYSNSYSKNKDIYEYSLKDKYPNVKFIE